MTRAYLFLACYTAALAQQASPPPASAQEEPPKQRTSAAAMEESLVKQRISIEQQVKALQAGAFFLLPPPASLGATTYAPVAADDCDPIPAAEADKLISSTASRQGVDENLLRNVIRQESSFRPCAVSSKGALGLMQLMPATLERLGVKNPLDPAENVDAGARFLKDLLVRYGGDLTRALGAYNAGPGKVDAANGVPEFPETLEYIKRILSALPPKR